MKNKLISIILAILCATVVFSGCTAGELQGGNLPDDDFEPEVDDGAESELFQRYQYYKDSAAAAFDEIAPAPSDSFVTEDVDGGVSIVQYVGKDKVVRIPDVIGDRAVVSIGEDAFADQNIRAIYVPDSVTHADMGALRGCQGILTVRLPDVFGGFLGYVFGAGEHSENAITVPSSLDTVILGDNATKIAENAFSGCKTLSAVVLPDTVESIGEFAFFECADLVYIELGSGIRQIGQYAFAECENLYEIDCKDARDIGLGAFYSCRSLNKITLGVIGNGQNAYFGYVFGAETVEYSAEYVPSSLRTVELNSSCQDIPAKAFAGCDRITKVVICEGSQRIGVRAFYRCRSLSEISMPDTLKSIGDDAFFGCDALVTVALGNGLESLGMQAFYGCGALKSIELPDTLEEIRPSTFYGCGALVTVKLGGVKKIGKDAFGKCSRLVAVKLDGIEVADGNDALIAVSGLN